LFGGSGAPIGLTFTEKTIAVSIVLSETYSTVYEFANSDDFMNAIGTVNNIKSMNNSCSGNTLTDYYNCNLDTSYNAFNKISSGVLALNQPIEVESTITSNIISLTIPAVKYYDGTTIIYEYNTITDYNIIYYEFGDSYSLHSNTNYEVCMVYFDKYKRLCSPQLSDNSSVYIDVDASGTINKLQVTIPPEQKPPYWATGYKFGIRQSKETYEGIMPLIYFSYNEAMYFLLQGENAAKIDKGDKLILKRDASGILTDEIELEVLDKTVENENAFTTNSPAGAYIKLDSDDIAPPTLSAIYNSSYSASKIKTDEWNAIRFSLEINDSIPINRGDIISIKVILKKLQKRLFADDEAYYTYTYNKSLVSINDYTDFFDWYENGSFNPDDGVEVYGTSYSSYNFYKNNNIISGSYTQGYDDLGHSYYQGGIYFYHLYNGAHDKHFFTVIFGGQVDLDEKCINSGQLSVTITNTDGISVFETKRETTVENVFYEGNQTYEIIDGYHQGDTNQTDTQAAVVDLNFANCICFGNGVESYKYKDSLTGNYFNLGERALTLEEQEYEKKLYYASLNYSGFYSMESNINNLNSFNIGLLNFKQLKKEHGSVWIIESYNDNMLVIQENKISEVLISKKILSDLSSQELLTAVTEVLGDQRMSISNYGTSSPESYVTYQGIRFFVDENRHVLIALGNNVNEIDVISKYKFVGYFKNKLDEYKDNYKIGGYDVKKDEYILTFSDDEITKGIDVISCGEDIVVNINTTSYEIEVDYGNGYSEADVYIECINNPFAQINLFITYNEIEYIDTITGSGTVTFDKNKIDVTTAIIEVTTTDDLIVRILPNCTERVMVKTHLICLSSPDDARNIIYNKTSYKYNDYKSDVNTELLKLKNLTSHTFPYVVSKYETIDTYIGSPLAAPEGSTVYIISDRGRGIGYFNFDKGQNKLRYLVSTIEYTEADLIEILSGATAISLISSNVYGRNYGTFTMPTLEEGYNIYLIWDYRKGKSVSLYYNGTSEKDACCSTGNKTTYYLVQGYDFSTATTIYEDAELTTVAKSGYYSNGIISRELNDEFLPSNKCTACNPLLPVNMKSDSVVGSYNSSISTGETVGAIVVVIKAEVFFGIVLTYDSKDYTTVVSVDNGEYTDISSLGVNYINNPEYTCFDTSYNKYLTVYEYTNDYNDLGITKNVTISDAEDINECEGDTFYIIIPKSDIANDILTAEVQLLCENSSFELYINSPILLPTITTSEVGATSAETEILPMTSTFYYYSYSSEEISLYGMMFDDENGSVQASDGFYKISKTQYVEILNGVVIEIGDY
jgi:hypothetical protein